MIVENTGGFVPAPEGFHLARCFRIVDLGTQETQFEGKPKFNKQIKVLWELHGEDMTGKPLTTDDNEPMSITKDYNVTWGEKGTLRRDLQAWRGREFTPEEQRRFDLKNILDKWCMLNVQHKAKKNGNGFYANVVSIAPVPAAMKGYTKNGFNKAEIFYISEPDMDLYKSFSPWLQALIAKSPEWQQAHGLNSPAIQKMSKGGSGFDDMDDDIPF